MAIDTPPKKTFKKRLSTKQKGFARDIAMGETATKAVLNHYDINGKDPAKIASVMGVENLGKPSVIAEIERQTISLKSALEKQGVSPEKIALKIDELLDSKETQAIDKGLKHATNIYGVEDLNTKPKGNTYNFLFSAETKAKVRELEDEIKAKILNHD